MHGAAACVTVNVLPPMVSVPVRLAPVLAAAEKVTTPLVVPLAPDVTVSHDGALLTAVHEQAPPVTVTPTDDAPPATGAVQDDAASV